jgi:hypothetical protein
MKIYFDNTTQLTIPNCEHLSKNDSNIRWLTSPGTRLKQELKQLAIPYYNLKDIDEPGLYFVEVNNDPVWWCGLCELENGPPHILYEVPKDIINLVREKKLRLIISADREGGGMIFEGRDGFKATTDAMQQCNLPAGSILIIQGNSKIENQYNTWLSSSGQPRLFEVKYSNHFDKIFINSQIPTEPIVCESMITQDVKDFNSLNRTYKSHRSAHLYVLAVNRWLDNGLVSANEIRKNNESPLKLLKIISSTDDFIKQQLINDFDAVIESQYPRYVDGDWSINNAANSVNKDIFKNSLLSFVTETKFDEDVIFLTEKVFKCLAYGHPMIVLGPCGTLKALEKLGYRTDVCGINPGYNDIKNHSDRFFATHRALEIWIKFSPDQKRDKIKQALPAIQHNLTLSASRNFYHESLISIINFSKEYFND